MLVTIVRFIVSLLVLCLAAVRPLPQSDVRDDVSRLDGTKARVDAPIRRAPEARDARSLRGGARDGRLLDAIIVDPPPFTIHRHAVLAETSEAPRAVAVPFSVARSARGPPV